MNQKFVHLFHDAMAICSLSCSKPPGFRYEKQAQMALLRGRFQTRLEVATQLRQPIDATTSQKATSDTPPRVNTAPHDIFVLRLLFFFEFVPSLFFRGSFGIEKIIRTKACMYNFFIIKLSCTKFLFIIFFLDKKYVRRERHEKKKKRQNMAIMVYMVYFRVQL